ncbi:sugar ABC transporter permease [Sphaerisporangium rufum]|uniref:Sugar ABC transporter permease n=1 Tax=Sphaerisporangium rufum TaxID=1381558 RepID=A0A919UVP4_9ACTN|nr:carbohydrate ABC transporter permease [Sphaerisporangium rufum]GII75266.1 sugar ABC transporter permease [Sphaerisporangium rufum]
MSARARAGAVRRNPLTYLTLLAIAFFSAFPIYWSVVVASHDNAAMAELPPPLLPGGNLFANIARVFDTAPFALALVNSVVVAGAITVSVMLFSTLAGFAFAKLRFRGRSALLMITVGTMMVPAQLGIIPLYLLMIKLQWNGTIAAVIVPSLVSAFGVFFMTQFLSRALPSELLEAGRVDGASTIRLFWHVVLPVARPAAAVLGMLTFMTAWNDYFWPLVVLTPDDPTVQVALSSLASGYVQDFTLALAGTAVATLPLVTVFVLLGRQIIGGIMQGAVKG